MQNNGISEHCFVFQVRSILKSADFELDKA